MPRWTGCSRSRTRQSANSPTARLAVQKDIVNREEHHRVKSIREELVAMLAKAGIEYDPRYLD